VNRRKKREVGLKKPRVRQGSACASVATPPLRSVPSRPVTPAHPERLVVTVDEKYIKTNACTNAHKAGTNVLIRRNAAL
jgi:hypothetical protein